MLKDIVVSKIVQGEGGRVRLRIGGDGEVEQNAAECLVDVEGV